MGSGEAAELPWCPFCGGQLKPTTKTKEIVYEGRHLRIHRDDYREFQETGMLRYLESPRSGPFSPDAIDLAIILVVAIVLALLYIWMIASVG